MDEEEAERLVDELAEVVTELNDTLPEYFPLNVAYRVDGSPIIGEHSDAVT